MQLTFEHTTNLGTGINPAAIHINTGEVYLFAGEDGRLKAKSWNPGSGNVDWSAPVFGEGFTATRDTGLSLYRMKNVPRVGMFGAWHQDGILDGETVITPERQRFAIWDALNDISNYLDSCDIRMDLDNPISSAGFTFKNPNQYLSGEKNSRINPGNKIELFFTAGDSEDYPMGVFYIDRTDMEVTGDSVSVDSRSITGKALKDQSFDENNAYPYQVYAYNVKDILDNAGITNYDIQQPPNPETAWKTGMEFPPDMDMFTGLMAYLSAAYGWVARETLDGQLIVGSAETYNPLLLMNSKYTFNRGSDLISRGVQRDDSDVYSRVCYQSRNEATDTMIRAYASVLHAHEWAYAPHKTLYITMPDNAVLGDLQTMADNLANRMSQAGIMEQFTGPFRPHIIPGDSAEIVSDDGTYLLGLITTVNHRMGSDGYTTSFTVDSAGILGKPRLKDMISKASNDKPSGIKQIY